MMREPDGQRGQAIAIVAVILVVLFGFLGLAIDGGRGYLDRRQLQASVDAAALAAAYNYMNNQDYSQAQQAAVVQFAEDQRLYVSPACSGYGSTAASCSFGDPTGQTLTITVADHSIAGVTFTATTSHRIPVTIMQVLGAGPSIAVGATATAVARKQGTNGAAIETLSPGGCSGGGGGGQSLTFQGSSTTNVTGDVWSNGSIFDNSHAAGGSVNGNVIAICPATPFLTTPTPWAITGTQSIGFNLADPGYAQPPLNAIAQAWNAASGSTEQPGTYAADPGISGGSPCFFLAPGVYDFAAGFTDNAGFMSNELRPPDEPEMASAGTPNTTTLSATLSGLNQTSIPVSALPGAVPSGATVYVGGQGPFITSANASAGATSIPISKTSVSPAIPSGSIVSIRALPQFWDSNGVSCSGTFSLANTGSGSFISGTWSVEVTAVRWESTGAASCSGPSSGSCYERESAPSMCKTIALGSSGNIKVSVSSPPGAQSFNVYLAQNGSCTSLAYLTSFPNSGSVGTVINSASFPAGWPAGAAAPPDGEGMAIASGLPNADGPAGVPPRGDMANERECVETGGGSPVACPGAWTPGAVVFYIPSTGCLDTHGGRADMYLFSGYQYNRVLLFEPGPEQSGSPNTCNNRINGNGFTSLIGVIYTPAAGITINGSSTYQATIAGGIIAWTATITGNGGVAITADPSLRPWPSLVRLTQ